MFRGTAVSAVVTIAVSVSGCDPASQDEGLATEDHGFTLRDSAGIEIVENHAPEYADGEFWTIDPEPEIVLGGSENLSGLADDSAQLIWSVVGLARLPDGRVAVLSSENKQLMLFEPSGELAGIVGGPGEGPGEFTRPERLQYLPPDTLVVWDYFLSAIDYFDSSGKLLRERTVDYTRLRELGAWGESRRLPLGVSGNDGLAAATGGGRAGAQEGEVRLGRIHACESGGIPVGQGVVGLGVRDTGPVERLQPGGAMAGSAALSAGSRSGGLADVWPARHALLGGKGLLSGRQARRAGGGAGGGVSDSPADVGEPPTPPSIEPRGSRPRRGPSRHGR